MKSTLATLAVVLLVATGCSSGAADETDAEPATSTATSDQTTEAPSGPSESEVTSWARSQAGLSPGGGYESTGGWMDYFVSARVEGSRLYIRLQVPRSDKDTAERAQRLYINSLRSGGPAWADDVKWVIVEDGSGVVITQEMV